MPWVYDDHELQKAAERLVPNDESGGTEITSASEYYDYSKDPGHWRTFRGFEKNYAVCRADFIFTAETPATPLGSLSEIEVVHQQAGTVVDHEEAAGETGSPPLLWSQVRVTELRLKEARRIGQSLLIPGMSVYYDNFDFMAGYSGYKAWLIEDGDKDPSEVFWVPPTASDTGNSHPPIYDDAGEEVTMPRLGMVSAREQLALGGRLMKVAEQPTRS